MKHASSMQYWSKKLRWFATNITPAGGWSALMSSSPSTNMRFAIAARTQTYDTPRSQRFCSHLPRGSSFANSANRSASRSIRVRSPVMARAEYHSALCPAAWLTRKTAPTIFRNVLMSLEFSAEAQTKIAALCARYPTKKPVVLAALHLAQKEFGHLSDDAMRLVGKTLDLPYA